MCHFLPKCIVPWTIQECCMDSSEEGLIVVMFCSDLPVKRCEGHCASLSQFLQFFLMQYIKVWKFVNMDE